MAAVMRQFSSHVDPALLFTRDEARSALSRRELEVVTAVTQGFRNKEIAGKLSITEQTVKNHLHSIFEKLAVSDRLELALYAVHNNLRTPPIAGAPGFTPRNESGLHVCPRVSAFT